MRYSAICGLMLFFGMAPPADAGLVTYADYANWSSAVTGISTVTIPNITAYLGQASTSATFDGVTFSTDETLGDPRVFTVSTAITTTIPIFSLQQTTVGLNHLIITFPEPTTAFAFNYGTFSRFAPINIIVPGIGEHLSTADREVRLGTGDGYATTGFFGAIKSNPFQTIYLVTDKSNVMNVGNVAYANADAAPVPEPGTLALFGLGSLCIVGLARRRLVAEPHTSFPMGVFWTNLCNLRVLRFRHTSGGRPCRKPSRGDRLMELGKDCGCRRPGSRRHVYHPGKSCREVPGRQEPV